MMNRSILLCGLTAVLAMVFWIAGPAPAEAWATIGEDPYGQYPSCCADFEQLQGQSCTTGVRVACSWGSSYGSGYCQCYYGYSWECYSYQSIPTNPGPPLCD